ncbi:MAG: exodeoxyribonuclease V subunit alpha [Spirochaetales bacterium]|nr:exodeoxyribonuclease V subunit alpha [Spirochaetales bacterium]
MKQEFGSGLKEFLKNRDYANASQGLKSLYSEYKTWDKFVDFGKNSGFKWSQIYLVKNLVERFATVDDHELKILLLHILYQYEIGNLRTSIKRLNIEIAEWYQENVEIDYSKYIDLNPNLFGTASEPFLIVDSYIYINRIKKYEERFLSLLGSRLEECKKNSNFSIISGGPGTGKTTMVVSIIRDLINEGITNIALAAPTGRAAKRVIESINRELKDSDVNMPQQAYTLHKLLGISPNRDTPKYCSKRPLKYDVVIVDEASMVDIHMMFRLFDALPVTSKLILVGDKDQLPSVEAGALLGDFLYNYEDENHKMHNNITVLNKSFRSSKHILDCAKLVILGNANEVINFLKNMDNGILYNQLPNIDILITKIIGKYSCLPIKPFNVQISKYLQFNLQIEEAFKVFEEFTILTPSRKGLYGTKSLNNILKNKLNGGYKEFYHCQPIMITKNDYVNDLYNGDRGLIFEFSNGVFAFFRDGSGFKIISVSKISDFETSYAGTVHKSQGSEYDSVTIIIPEGSEKLLTREILYTALTRAKKTVSLYSNDNEIILAVNRKIVRESGIRSFLMYNDIYKKRGK